MVVQVEMITTLLVVVAVAVHLSQAIRVLVVLQNQMGELGQ